MEPWFSQMKSDRVGELPEATNESSCEDIIPPLREDALESNGEGLRWVLPPTGRIPSFEGEHRGLFSGSVAGRLESPSLLILVKAYPKCALPTIVRKLKLGSFVRLCDKPGVESQFGIFKAVSTSGLTRFCSCRCFTNLSAA
jgi:hypothetical protein